MLVNINLWVLKNDKKLFPWTKKKLIYRVQMAFRKYYPEENYSTRHSKRGSLRTWGAFSSSGKLELQFVIGQQKAADYVKMLNELSLAQEWRRLCGKEWIFQQDNAAIHNASVKRSACLNKNKISWPSSVLSRPQSYWKLVGIDCCKS